MIRLYLTPLPEQTTDTASDQVGSQVQQAGLLETGGTSVENIATENVDFRKQGRIQLGPTLSRKVANELDSLSESAYTSLPLFDASGASLGRKAGYYEVTRADVTPAQEARDDAYQYDLVLAKAGTREDSRRAVRTNPQSIDSVYSDPNADSLVAIPDAATDMRWFDDANGTEPATAVETAESEFGTVARYDPGDASFSAPTLTFDLAFTEEGRTDVRVYDSLSEVKFAATASGGEVSRWVHAYHTGYQFSGAGVIDTGRFRLYLSGAVQSAAGYDSLTTRTVATGTTDTITSGNVETDSQLVVEDGGSFVVESGATHVLVDEDNLRGDVLAQEYNADTGYWANVALDTGSPWSLDTWSLTRIQPARVRARTRWSDGSTSATIDFVAERGADRLAWVTPENASAPPQGLVDLLAPTSKATDTLAFGTQGLIDRGTRDE